MLQIKTMIYSGIPQVINKTPIEIDAINGVFRQPYDLMDPEIDMSGSEIVNDLREGNVNYFNIENKFYYLVDWQLVNNKLARVRLHLDVLKTYAEEVGKIHVMLERSSGSYNSDLPDNMMPLTANRIYEDVNFPNRWDDSEQSGAYVMATSQKGYYPYGGEVEG